VLHLSSLVLLLLIAAGCSDDGSTVTTPSTGASGSGSTSEEAEADDPLPAGCEVSNGVVAVLDDTIAVRLEPTGVELDRATARAGVLELRATNAGTADDTLTIADNRGQIVGAILAGAGLVCPGHFRLPPGSYRLRWGATEAALTLRPG